MFIGHFSLALAAKKIAPKTSLGTLMVSVAFVDLLWPFFIMFGWEHARVDPGNTAFTPIDLYDYPYSHSLVAGIGWSLLFGGVYYALKRYKPGAIVLGLGVLSHWVLDFISHRPDMPVLLSGGPKLGLGLWNSVAGTLAVEIPMFAAGIWIYLSCTRPKDSKGTWGFWAFMALMLVIYFGNAFGPPPPSVDAIAWMGPVVLVLYAIPYWVDRHRVAQVR
jgi:hypothetical protein